MKVIVTGANGFIGFEFVKKCLKNNILTIAIDFSFDNLKNILDKNLILIKAKDNVFELKDKISLRGFDAFYNLAWKGVNGSEKGNYNVQLNNIKLALDYATLAKDLGTKKYIVSGSIAEDAVNCFDSIESFSPSLLYGVSKYSCHLFLCAHCKLINLDFIWLKFANIYGINNKTGNFISFCFEKFKKNEDILCGPATQPYDFIFINDLIDALFLLCFKDKTDSFYYVGSGKPKILKEYLFYLGDVFNKKEKIKIGALPFDGIKYSFLDMSNDRLTKCIGNYISLSFEERIKKIKGELDNESKI